MVRWAPGPSGADMLGVVGAVTSTIVLIASSIIILTLHLRRPPSLFPQLTTYELLMMPYDIHFTELIFE